MGIKVNDNIEHFFPTKKLLRQGDSLHPMLFNIVADMLTVLIGRAKDNDKVGGLMPHLWMELSILHYADDMIFFMQHDMVRS